MSSLFYVESLRVFGGVEFQNIRSPKARRGAPLTSTLRRLACVSASTLTLTRHGFRARPDERTRSPYNSPTPSITTPFPSISYSKRAPAKRIALASLNLNSYRTEYRRESVLNSKLMDSLNPVHSFAPGHIGPRDALARQSTTPASTLLILRGGTSSGK